MDLKILKTTQSRIDILNAMNIHSLYDLLSHYPYRYEVIEETYPTDNDDRIIIEATLISPVKLFFKGKMSSMSFMVEDCNLNQYNVVIFNRHYLRAHLNIGVKMTILGKCHKNKINTILP